MNRLKMGIWHIKSALHSPPRSNVPTRPTCNAIKPSRLLLIRDNLTRLNGWALSQWVVSVAPASDRDNRQDDSMQTSKNSTSFKMGKPWFKKPWFKKMSQKVKDFSMEPAGKSEKIKGLFVLIST